MDAADTRAWVALLRITALGGAATRRLLEYCGGPAAAVAGSAAQWARAGLDPRLHADLQALEAQRLDADLAWLAEPDHHLLPYDHPLFPERLRNIDACPPALYAVGEPALLAMPQLAIVGARSASPPGLATAADFAAELTRRGLVVTSGLAAGIDGAAHQGALDAGGLTIAVCATGLDRVYPAAHRGLARRIGEAGLLVSEFPPGTRPRAQFFPRRNRIIAGLSLGVLVVEAALESGSLITARLAAEQGREVFAIPGSIHHTLARGCHQLIRNGAKLVESANDIIDELRPQLTEAAVQLRAPGPAVARQAQLPPDPALAALLDCMGWQAWNIDPLLTASGLTLEGLSGALLQLEIDGWVSCDTAGRYLRLPPA